MSRMWLNNGRAVLADGQAVLCDECPCGCRYTYYVDHSLATSGDGHSWETAFKSVNDVFNSSEIRSYRLSGCIIYVKIRGEVNYSIAGTYLYNYAYAIPFSTVDAYVYLQPQSTGYRVSATSSTLVSAKANLIAFDQWDIVSSATPQSGFLPYDGVFKFFSCNITNNHNMANGTGNRVLFGYLSSIYKKSINFIDCILTINVSNPSHVGGFIGITAISPGGITIVDNCTININIDTGSTANSLEDNYGVSHNGSTNPIILENSTVNFNINTVGGNDQTYHIAAFYLYQTTGTVTACDSSRNINVSPAGYDFCRFAYTANEYDNTYFYGCIQDSFITPGHPAVNTCPELS